MTDDFDAGTDPLDTEDACELEGGEPEVLDPNADLDVLEEEEPDFAELLPERNRGQMHEASEEDFQRWAERYDDLNGAPDSEEDQ